MISLEEFKAIAHRTASRYSHRSEPEKVAYTFLPHTLEDFYRQVCAAIQAIAPVPAVPTCRVADRGFRFDGVAQHHVPHVLVEFEPVPVNGPIDSKGWVDRNTFAAMLSAAPQPAQQVAQQAPSVPDAQPFGQVAVYRSPHPNYVTRYEFYPWPQPPYLDNASECVTVYTRPQASKPMTDEQIGKGLMTAEREDGDCDPRDFERGVRFAERHHGIKE
jgi:hypothetical protein